MAKRTKQQAEKEKTHETSTVAKRTRQQTDREEKTHETSTVAKTTKQQTEGT